MRCCWSYLNDVELVVIQNQMEKKCLLTMSRKNNDNMDPIRKHVQDGTACFTNGEWRKEVYFALEDNLISK